MRIRMLGNTTMTEAVASCGHAIKVVVPPHDVRSGPGVVGQRRIAEAKASVCEACGGSDLVGSVYR